MGRFFVGIVGLVISLVLVNSAFGQIVINEFQIEPEQSIELYNPSTETIDLGSWVLDDSGGTTFYTLPVNSLISPLSCLVFTANFNLNRTSSDLVRLFNPQQVLVDSHAYDQSPGLGHSWQRIPQGEDSWQSGESTLAKNNTTGESCLALSETSPTLTPIPTFLTPSEIPPSLTPTPIGKIYLNEALVNPEDGPEWVEIYNQNDFVVELLDLYLDDSENSGSTPKKFSLKLAPQSYAIIELTAVFNNDCDSVRLLNSQKQEIDSFEYANSEKGESYSRQALNEGVWCKTLPSPERANNPCLESPSAIVLGTAITPSLSPTMINQPNFKTGAAIAPVNFSLITSFYPLTLNKPKVLGAKKNPLKSRWQKEKIKRALMLSRLWFSLNFGLNFALILYILCYYDAQKKAPLSLS